MSQETKDQDKRIVIDLIDRAIILAKVSIDSAIESLQIAKARMEILENLEHLKKQGDEHEVRCSQ